MFTMEKFYKDYNLTCGKLSVLIEVNENTINRYANWVTINPDAKRKIETAIYTIKKHNLVCPQWGQYRSYRDWSFTDYMRTFKYLLEQETGNGIPEDELGYIKADHKEFDAPVVDSEGTKELGRLYNYDVTELVRGIEILLNYL